MKARATIERIELRMEDLEKILERAKTALGEEDHEKLRQLVDSFVYLTQLVEDKGTTIRHLRKLLFGSTSEKSGKLFGGDGKKKSPRGEPTGQHSGPGEKDPRAPRGDGEPQESKEKRRGHGRNGAAAYEGAERIQVSHESLAGGDSCPECNKGKVYQLSRPRSIVWIVGMPPLRATVYELTRLRCNLCGTVFTAAPPAGIDDRKYEATSAAMIGLLKYGSGLPFNRLEGLQGNLGVPLPASTQWDIVQRAAGQLEPVFEELIRQGAQGEVLHNDDTTMRILTLMKENEDWAQEPEGGGSGEKHRTGVFTSGIVSTRQGQRVALFFSGRQHAGENLADVLAKREPGLDPPKQMCDGLSRNLPGDLRVLLGNCLAHARRQFVAVLENFPQECRHVIEELGKVYKTDAEARRRNLTGDERLALHRAQSGPVMEELHARLTRQLDEKLVEPNSGLGKAIAYMLKRWERLTLFLREPGAPLDNNICERALKKAILHRRNSLFYKTETGAHVGDVFMSLIYTCQLSGANAFEYLTALLRHPGGVSRVPAAWMPWNYQAALNACATPR